MTWIIQLCIRFLNFATQDLILLFREACLTPAISRRAHNLENTQVSRMKATLFAVGCMALLDLPYRIPLNILFVPLTTLWPSISLGPRE
jgi:hypothetical protein